ncbi:hypothetical protein GEMRC1_009986 [Eukaryota sp. GEM-RC1]
MSNGSNMSVAFSHQLFETKVRAVAPLLSMDTDVNQIFRSPKRIAYCKRTQLTELLSALQPFLQKPTCRTGKKAILCLNLFNSLIEVGYTVFESPQAAEKCRGKMPISRTRISRPIDKKLEIVSSFKNSGSIAKKTFAKQMNVSLRSLNRYIQQETHLLYHKKGVRLPGGGRPYNKELEEILLAWVRQTRDDNLPVTIISVCEKANEIRSSDESEFTPRMDHYLLKRNGYSYFFFKNLNDALTIEDYPVNKERIYNLDETAVFVEENTKHTYEAVNTSVVAVRGQVHEKFRLTGIFCASATGVKHPPILLIHGEVNSIDFSLDRSHIVMTTVSRRSWMNSELFILLLDFLFPRKLVSQHFRNPSCPRTRNQTLKRPTDLKLGQMMDSAWRDVDEDLVRHSFESTVLCHPLHSFFARNQLFQESFHIAFNEWEEGQQMVFSNDESSEEDEPVDVSDEDEYGVDLVLDLVL